MLYCRLSLYFFFMFDALPLILLTRESCLIVTRHQIIDQNLMKSWKVGLWMLLASIDLKFILRFVRNNVIIGIRHIIHHVIMLIRVSVCCNYPCIYDCWYKYVLCCVIQHMEFILCLLFSLFNSNFQCNLIVYLGFASPIAEPSKMGLKGEGMSDRHNSNWCSKVGCFFCSFLVREDCRSNEDINLQQQSGEEDALFCTLCNAEVGTNFLKNFILFS